MSRKDLAHDKVYAEQKAQAYKKEIDLQTARKNIDLLRLDTKKLGIDLFDPINKKTGRN